MRVRGGRNGDQHRDLAAYLDSQDRLRGRVHLISGGTRPGGMSQSTTTVLVELLGPGALAFAMGVVTWIRNRTSDTRVTVRRADGLEFELTAQRVRRMGKADMQALVTEMAAAVGEVEQGNPVDAARPPRAADGVPEAEPEDEPATGGDQQEPVAAE